MITSTGGAERGAGSLKGVKVQVFTDERKDTAGDADILASMAPFLASMASVLASVASVFCFLPS